LWLLVCVLLALVQIPWAGYQLGVGNQGVQVAFLEKLQNPLPLIRARSSAKIKFPTTYH
jgi:hypothetical protein